MCNWITLLHVWNEYNIVINYLLLFRLSAMSDSLWLHELQRARLLCPSLSPRACSDSCPLSWWCYLTISFSATLFSFRLQSFPASGSFLHIRWPEYWSFSFSISPSSEYSGLISFRIDWFDLLAVHRTLKESSPAWQFKSISALHSTFFIDQFHIHTWLWEKP